MNKPEELDSWDFPDTKRVPDGYNLKTVPECTNDNFLVLLREHNNLVAVVNELAEKNGFEFNTGKKG